MANISRLRLLLCALFFILNALALSIFAQTDEGVTVFAPDGDVDTLIRAIRKANSDPLLDIIELAEGGTYTLTEFAETIDGTNGLFAITSQIKIIGNGATIERDSNAGIAPFRLFYVAEGGTLALENLTLRNGYALGESNDGTGAAIWNMGELTIENCVLEHNQAEYRGGAIANLGGTITISRTTLDDNWSPTGGAIYNLGPGVVSISESTISNNQSSTHGGAIVNTKGGTLTIRASTLNDNHARQFGGALKNNGAATIINSTFSENQADMQGGAINNGGGINNRDLAPLVIVNTTFYENVAQSGGTIFGTGSMTFLHTLIDSSGSEDACITQLSIATDSQSDPVLYEADVITLGVNLTSDESCPGFSRVEASALAVEPLADNGGPTLTHTLPVDSVAVDAGAECTDAEGQPLLTDQRGVQRPQGSGCDIGAFEREAD